MRRQAAGKRGFQLLLLGFEPLDVFGHLVHEGRGRRLSFAAPDWKNLTIR
jgi:hypothetical protein